MFTDFIQKGFCQYFITLSAILLSSQVCAQNKKVTYIAPGDAAEIAFGVGYEEDEFKVSGANSDIIYQFSTKDLNYITTFLEPHMVHRELDLRFKAQYGVLKNDAMGHLKGSHSYSNANLHSHFYDLRGSLGYILKLTPDHVLQTNLYPTVGYEAKDIVIKNVANGGKIKNHIKNEGPFVGASLVVETHKNFEMSFAYFYHWLDVHLQTRSLPYVDNISMLKINQRLNHSFEHEGLIGFLYRHSRHLGFGVDLRYQYISTPAQSVDLKIFETTGNESLEYLNLFQRQETYSIDLFLTFGF